MPHKAVAVPVLWALSGFALTAFGQTGVQNPPKTFTEIGPQRGPVAPAHNQSTSARNPAPPREWIYPLMLGISRFNVKNFGAVCDGVTDDTAAIQNTYNAAANAMFTAGGAGIIYFPPSSGYCKVTRLRIPSMGYSQGWLTSIFDNGLLVTDTVIPGKNNAFIGRTSNFRGLGYVFLRGPSAEWQKPKESGVTTAPVLDLVGADQVYFDGIAFGDASGLASEVIHMHDNNGAGSTYITFEHCSVMGDFDIDGATPETFAGFGLYIENTAMADLNITNFGIITIRGSYIHKMRLSNAGASNTGDVELDDILSESLNNEDFLTIDTSGGNVADVILNRVRVADPVGTVYMVKHINNSSVNWLANIKFEALQGDIGSGLVDPASAPQLFSIICEGYGCEGVLAQAKSTLYFMEAIDPKGGLVVYGSQYVPQPLTVLH